MNKEDYVSLEVAKLLQEKGFREPCNAIYYVNRSGNSSLQIMFCLNEFEYLSKHNDGFQYEYLAPSLYEAQKWLRMKKRLHIEVNYMSGDYWIYEILTIPNHDLIGLSDRENVKYMNYEEALNAGIFEALKLI